MGSRKRSAARRADTSDSSIGVGDVALVASILGNLKFYGEKEELRSSVEALQRLVQDWQVAYQTLNAQLTLVLRTNQEQNQLIGTLREQLSRAQRRASEAENRILIAEAQRNRAAREASGTTGKP